FVVVGTIGRQEVQSDTAAEVGHGGLNNLAVVNPEVVEDHMDNRRLSVGLEQVVQQVDEQSAGFAFALHPEQPPGPRVQSTGQVSFHVFPRRQNLLLLAAHH